MKHPRQTYVALLLIFTPSVLLADPIGVLLARTVGVSDIEARAMLDQINELAENSDLDHLGGFVSVHNNQVYPAVEVVSCSSTNGEALVDCARNSLSAMRNSVSADIVLLMVYQDIAGDCGGVDPDMINRPTISHANQDLAYVVVEKGCFNQAHNGQVVASHEVGHVLSIEHVDGDPALSLPAGGGPANHAMENVYNNATAVASAGDCFPSCDFHNFFSDKDKDFSSLPLDDAGNSSHSNAVDVVESLSWNVVAAYRTPPPPPACHIVINQWCDGDSPLASVTPSLPGYGMTNVDFDYRRVNGSTWFPIYDGIPTCPVYNPPSLLDSIIQAFVTTATGYVTGCTVEMSPISCGGGGPGGGNN